MTLTVLLESFFRFW